MNAAALVRTWSSIQDIGNTFTSLGFDVRLKNDALLIRLDQHQDTYLKVMDQRRSVNKTKEFTQNVLYLLLIEDYQKFKFLKKTEVDGKSRLLKFEFSSKPTIEEKRKLNQALKPDCIPLFDNVLFESNELDFIVSNLKRILTSSTNKLSTAELKKLGDSLNLNTHKKQKPTDTSLKSSAKRALLVVASAALFHAKLDAYMENMKPEKDKMTNGPFQGNWPPAKLQECLESEDTVSHLLESWSLILSINYRLIFQTGLAVLNSNSSEQFNEIIKDILYWSRESVVHVSGLKHDILGRLFHTMLDDARYDGSFYTSVPSAVLLADLAIKNENIPKTLGDMNVIDPACGTGTLLMAVAERLRNLLGKKYDPKIIIEQVLTGIDINVTALHIAATTLGLLSPTTNFRHMDIRKVEFGISENGAAAAGSLELYDCGGLLQFFRWTENQASKQVESGEKRASYEYHNSADLVIMNPPFTRHDIRHDQLTPTEEKAVKKREQELFDNAHIAPDKTSSGLMFLILGEKLVNKTGTFAFVFPMSSATAPSASKVRKFLAQKFHIEYIISSHDPRRFWFSENTSISEILVIMKRKNRKQKTENKSTQIVNLSINPNTALDASKLANSIRNGQFRPDMKVINWSHKNIESGSWHGVQFFSPLLVDYFLDILNNKIFETKKLGDIADISPNGRTLSMYCKKSHVPGSYNWRSIYGHQTKHIISLQADPYTYILPKKGKLKEAKNFWSKRATLLLPETLQPNITHVSALNSSLPTVGMSWTPVRPYPNTTENPTKWSKAITAYLNSTVGIISMLGIRIPRKPLYPRFSITGCQDSIPIPSFSEPDIGMLSDIFDDVAKTETRKWSDPNDPIRIKLDKSLSKIIKNDYPLVEKIRFELSQEPMCTGKRHLETTHDHPSL